MRYAPLFDIADSSIWEEPYHVRILFITMMAKKGPDQVVYADEYRLKNWSKLNTLEEVYDALRILESPDPKRPKQPYEGRRIKKIDDGWLILNGMKYEEMMKKVNDRARKSRWARETRERQRSTKQPIENGLKDFNDHVENGHIPEPVDPSF